MYDHKNEIAQTVVKLKEILKSGQPIFYRIVKDELKGPRIGLSVMREARKRAGVITVNIDGAVYWQIPKKEGVKKC